MPLDENDATRLGKRGQEGTGDRTRLSARIGDDRTRLGSRAQGTDTTRLSKRDPDATRLSERALPQQYQTTGLAGPSGWGAAPATEIGAEETSAVYDPGVDGIVLTSYGPREPEWVPDYPQIPVPEVVPLAPELLQERARVRSDYARGTRIRVALLAGFGALGFAASVTGAILLAQTL